MDFDWKGRGLDWTGRRTAWIRREIIEDGTWTGPDLDWTGRGLVLDSHPVKFQDGFAYDKLCFVYGVFVLVNISNVHASHHLPIRTDLAQAPGASFGW